MRCRACATVHQLVANLALLLDHAGNTLLLGDPNETISSRTARARNAGHRWAAVACRVLTAVLGGHGDEDHCAYAIDATLPSMGREVWNWSCNGRDEGIPPK